PLPGECKTPSACSWSSVVAGPTGAPGPADDEQRRRKSLCAKPTRCPNSRGNWNSWSRRPSRSSTSWRPARRCWAAPHPPRAAAPAVPAAAAPAPAAPAADKERPTMKIGDIHALRHELEQLETETFEVLDFVDSPAQMLAGTTSTSSTSTCASCTRCTSCACCCPLPACNGEKRDHEQHVLLPASRAGTVGVGDLRGPRLRRFSGGDALGHHLHQQHQLLLQLHQLHQHGQQLRLGTVPTDTSDVTAFTPRRPSTGGRADLRRVDLRAGTATPTTTDPPPKTLIEE